MVVAFQSAITSEQVKTKAKEFGADLAGIADGQVMNENPHIRKTPKAL